MPLRAARILLLACLAASLLAGRGEAQEIRVVTYNTANDVSGNTGVDFGPRSGAADVLAAIGAENAGGASRPIDVLALQESVYNSGTGPNPTAVGFANLLNSIYNTNTFKTGLLNGSTDGNLVGNGPSTVVYNSATVTLVSEAALGTPSGSGEARQPMQYQFQPVGYTAAAQFTLFNDHSKSGTTASDNTRRGVEGNLVARAAAALPSGAAIIYAGDYNATNGTNDLGYKGIITGFGTMANHGIDPLDPTNATQNFSNSSTLAESTSSPATTAMFTGQSTSGMRYRDDFQLDSPGAYAGTDLSLVPNSYLAFGNTGTHTYGGSITSGSAAALAAELPGDTTSQAANVLTDLTRVADHLPVVADYQLNPADLAAVPEPSSIALALTGALVLLGYAGRRGRRG